MLAGHFPSLLERLERRVAGPSSLGGGHSAMALGAAGAEAGAARREGIPYHSCLTFSRTK